MIIATKIVLLVFCALFFLSALGAKEEKHSYFLLTGGTIAAVLLLLAMRLL